MLKEYETKFVIGEIVKFFVGGDPYVGEISKIFVDEYFKDIVRYGINSNGLYFVRYESTIEPYETETDEDYICEDCLLSQILDDVEEGELTANEAREILGLETINEELENYEFKTSGNAYFSIFPDDEHEDAIHIEIDPTWLWTNDDIDELIVQLKLAKVGNSNNDFRVEEVVDYYLDEAETIPVVRFEGRHFEFNDVKILEEIEKLVRKCIKEENKDPRRSY